MISQYLSKISNKKLLVWVVLTCVLILFLTLQGLKGYKIEIKVQDIGSGTPIQNAVVYLENSAGCPAMLNVKCDGKTWTVTTDQNGMAVIKKLKRDVYGFRVSSENYDDHNEAFTLDNKNLNLEVKLIPKTAKAKNQQDVWNIVKNNEFVKDWFNNNQRGNLLNEQTLNAAINNGSHWTFSFNVFENCLNNNDSLCPGETIKAEISTVSGEVTNIETFNQNQ